MCAAATNRIIKQQHPTSKLYHCCPALAVINTMARALSVAAAAAAAACLLLSHGGAAHGPTWCTRPDVYGLNFEIYPAITTPAHCTVLDLRVSYLTAGYQGLNWWGLDISAYLGATGVSAIAEALKTNTAITEVYLASDTFGHTGASAIAEMLKANTAITELTLDCCSIGPTGASAIAEALKTNTAITYLSISNDERVRYTTCWVA